MTIRTRHLSPATFGFVLFCFLLPFLTISCPAGHFTFSGVQLVTGTTIEQPTLFGQAETHEVDGEPLALLAALSALAGLLLALAPGKRRRLPRALVAGLGAVLLLALKAKIDSDALKQGEGLFQLSYGPGFWLAFLGFAAAAVVALRAPVETSPALAAGREGPASAEPVA